MRGMAARQLIGALAAGAGVLSGCAAAPVAPVDAVAAGSRKLGVELESRWFDVDGVRLHTVIAGPPNGAPVVLLHGEPEFWWAWHHQIAALARAGFRVVAPDLRGHNASDKPEAVAAYRLAELMSDLFGVLDELGYERVNLAGHDAGAGIVWYTAIEHPERVERFAVFGIGHPFAFRAMASGGEIPLVSKAFYAGLLTLLQTELPETIARAGNWALLTGFLRWSSADGAFPETEMDYYRYSWQRGGGIRGIANMYRAEFEFGPSTPYANESGRVEAPALIAVLGRDLTVPQQPARDSLSYCREARLVEFPDASHWILHEQPERASALLVEFFSAPSG